MGKKFKASTKLTAKFLVVLMVLQAVLFSLSAGAATSVIPNKIKIQKTAVTVSAPILMYTGATVPLTALYSNDTVAKITYTAPTWATTGGVTVSNTGTVTAGSTGRGTVGTVTATSGSLTDSVTFAVYKELKLFTFPTTGQTIKLGTTTQISEGNQTAGADVTSTTYAFADTKGAAVLTLNTVTGEVYAKAPGTAQVKVTKVLPIGTTNKVATITIKVPEPVKSLEISANGTTPAGATLGLNSGKGITLKTILTSVTGGKAKPTDTGVKWKLESGDISSFTLNTSTGVLAPVDKTDTAIGKSVVISATANDTLNSASDTITITIVKELKTATVKSVLLLKAGETKKIVPALSSGTAIAPTITSVTYTAETGKTATLTVDPTTGIVTAIASSLIPVKITVKVTAADGTVKTLLVNATVIEKVSKIVLTSPSTTLKPLKLYSKGSIKAVVTPASLKLNAVRYVSANPAIAFVNPYTGEVTAAGVGQTTITANADGYTSPSITIDVADTDGLLVP